MGKRLRIDFQAAFRWDGQPESLFGAVFCSGLFICFQAASGSKQG